MKRGASVVAETLREIARSERDFDLYDASWDADVAFGYLERIYDARNDLSIGDRTRTIVKTVKDNAQRYKRLKCWIEEEPDGLYRDIYQAEADLLEAYCYATIIRLRKDNNEELDGLRVTLTIGEEPMRAENNKSIEANRKRRATSAAKAAVGDKNMSDLEGDEIQDYDDAWNEAYRGDGGTDESAMSPARRHFERKKGKAQEKAEEVGGTSVEPDGE